MFLSKIQFQKILNYRCREWLLKCKRSDLLSTDTSELRICAKHFKFRMFTNTSFNHLIPFAIPSDEPTLLIQLDLIEVEQKDIRNVRMLKNNL